MSKLFSITNYSGAPITAGNSKIIPFSQIVRLDIPFVSGGFQWERPVSLLEIDAQGNERVIPIHDISRRILLGLLGASALLFVLTFRK